MTYLISVFSVYTKLETLSFERIKVAVSFTLKRDDALTLALTAAYKEGAAHDTT